MGSTVKKIALLSGGGDCPGLNAVIRTITKTAISKYGYEVIGFVYGYRGLYHNNYVELTEESVEDIYKEGGTILYSSNKDNLFDYLVDDGHGGKVKKEEDKGRIPDYIVEPSVDVVMGELLPKMFCMKMFTVLLDSNASEHAARTMAMQIATDNANDLLQDLTVMYNKSRQQAITNELLDIVGGSMA